MIRNETETLTGSLSKGKIIKNFGNYNTYKQVKLRNKSTSSSVVSKIYEKFTDNFNYVIFFGYY